MKPKLHVVLHEVDNGYMMIVGYGGVPCQAKEIYCADVKAAAEVLDDVVRSFRAENPTETLFQNGPVGAQLASPNAQNEEEAQGAASQQQASPQGD